MPTPSAGLVGWLGDGSDSTATFDGTATPAGMTKLSSAAYQATRDVFYTSIAISSGITIDMASRQLYCQGTLSGPSSGSHAVITCIQAGVASGTNNSVAGTNFSSNTSRGITLGIGIKGGNGGITTGSTAGDLTQAGHGSAGGAGGTGASGSGGAAHSSNVNTVVVQQPASSWRRFLTATTGMSTALDWANSTGTPNIYQLLGGEGGSGGGGDGTNPGGAGGAGGNILIVNARSVVGLMDFTAPGGAGLMDFTAPGGAGGTPITGNCGGGGGR